MATKTTDTDTELSAVNAILGAIGQSPITELKNPTTGAISNDNPEVQFIYNLLRDANVDTQGEGWHYNTEKHVEYTPDATTKKIEISDDLLKIDVTDPWLKKQYDVVRRSLTVSGTRKHYLYDKLDHTDEWDGPIDLDVVKLYPFEDLPPIFRRYITYRAARQAATQLVANPELVKLLSNQELSSRAALVEYECNQGNHNMMGIPDDTVYQTYQPWRNLRR